MRTAHELIRETSAESVQESSKNASQKNCEEGCGEDPQAKANPRYEYGLPSEQDLNKNEQRFDQKSEQGL